MNKCILSFILIALGFGAVRAQNYPYLNASTGNAGQYAVDKDTNIFMYHGSRLEKLDKNFGQIWVNAYSNFVFRSILLSKTGSIFFIGSPDKFGKINSDGSISWVKSLASLTVTAASVTQICSNVSLMQLMLDRNNNLVYSGTLNSGSVTCAFMLKTDTAGSILKFKLFPAPVVYGGTYNFRTFHVMNDLSGNYNFFTYGAVLGGNIISVLNFSDAADSLNMAKYGTFFYPYNIYTGVYYKSKFGDSHYFATTTYSITETTGIIKFNSSGLKWGTGFSWAGSTWFWGFDEADNGDVLYTTSTSVTSANFNAGYVKMDSNGVYPPKLFKHFNNYPVAPSFPYNSPSCRLNAFYGKKYFIEPIGGGFSSNPLSLGVPDSTLNMTCSNTISIGNPLGSSGILASNTIPKTIDVTSYTLAAIGSAATAVTNYSINTNFCVIMGVEGFVLEEEQVSIYPNPSSGIVKVIGAGNDFSCEVYNALGEKIVVKERADLKTEIDLSQQAPGIYFVRVITDNRNIIKKIIKE